MATPPVPLLPGTRQGWPGGWIIGCDQLTGDEARRRLRAGVIDGQSTALIDAAAGPLQVAAAHSGRRMKPFGGGGRSLLRDLLSEAGVARGKRPDWPVVETTLGEPIWLCALRASRLAPILPESQAALLLYTQESPRALRSRDCGSNRP